MTSTLGPPIRAERTSGRALAGRKDVVTNPYAALLSTPHARGFVVAGFVGRLPMSMLTLGTVVLISALTGSYGLAGAVSAVLSVAMAAVAPTIGRLTDRYGQRRVLVPEIAVHTVGLLGLVAAAVMHGPMWTLFVAALVAGGASPPVGSLVRARWTTLLGRTPRLNTAFSFESAVDELVFVVGPVLVTVLATSLWPAAGLLSALAFVLAGGLAFAAQRRTEPPPRPPESGGHAAIRSTGLQVLVLAYVAVGAVFGTVEVSMVAFTREHGVAGASGPLLALFALGSLLAGLAYGARQWQASLRRRFVMAVVVLSVGTIPIALADSIPVMVGSVFVVGFAVSPTIIAGYGLIEALVPPAALTEGFAWLSTAIGIGLAVGSSITGRVIDAADGHVAFRVAVVAGLTATAIALVGSRALRPARAVAG